ncbi:hypothetical protein P7C70_g1045, partial [Phenoliferia sp. Uapishka_3]
MSKSRRDTTLFALLIATSSFVSAATPESARRKHLARAVGYYSTPSVSSSSSIASSTSASSIASSTSSAILPGATCARANTPSDVPVGCTLVGNHVYCNYDYPYAGKGSCNASSSSSSVSSKASSSSSVARSSSSVASSSSKASSSSSAASSSTSSAVSPASTCSTAGQPSDIPAGCTLVGDMVTCYQGFTSDGTGGQGGLEVSIKLPSYANTVSATLIGAAGGGISDEPALSVGGLGCIVTGTISGQAGQTLYLEVGGHGNVAAQGYANGETEFGGGARGGKQDYSATPYSGAAGGGATSIRTISISGNSLDSSNSRLITAGGGGGSVKGAVISGAGIGGACGMPGSLVPGSAAKNPAQPGTLTAGGAAGDLSPGSKSNNLPGTFDMGGMGGWDSLNRGQNNCGAGGGAGAGGSSSDGTTNPSSNPASILLTFKYLGQGRCSDVKSSSVLSSSLASSTRSASSSGASSSSASSARSSASSSIVSSSIRSSSSSSGTPSSSSAVAAPSCSGTPADVPKGCTLVGQNVVCTYQYTGFSTNVTLPTYADKVLATLIGAQGGLVLLILRTDLVLIASGVSSGVIDEPTLGGGLGCIVTGMVYGQAGKTLWLDVGAAGIPAQQNYLITPYRLGGGGSGGQTNYYQGPFCGASGGGSTSVRTIMPRNDLAFDAVSSNSRLLVAGGGGGTTKGALANGAGIGGACGNPGTLVLGTSVDSSKAPTAGTLIAGGQPGSSGPGVRSIPTAGSLDLGGQGDNDAYGGRYSAGGGGGGGLFGGGGGSSGDSSGGGQSSGAGGSSSDGTSVASRSPASIVLTFPYQGTGVSCSTVSSSAGSKVSSSASSSASSANPKVSSSASSSASSANPSSSSSSCPDLLAATCDKSGNSLTCLLPQKYALGSTGKCQVTFARYIGVNFSGDDLSPNGVNPAKQVDNEAACASYSLTLTGFEHFSYGSTTGPPRMCFPKNGNNINGAIYSAETFPTLNSSRLGSCSSVTPIPSLSQVTCETVTFTGAICEVVGTFQVCGASASKSSSSSVFASSTSASSSSSRSSSSATPSSSSSKSSSSSSNTVPSTSQTFSKISSSSSKTVPSTSQTFSKSSSSSSKSSASSSPSSNTITSSSRAISSSSSASRTSSSAASTPTCGARNSPADVPAGCYLTSGVVSCAFTYTSAEMSIKLPAYARSVNVTLIGAAGGGIADEPSLPVGLGCIVSGNITGRGGQTLYVDVGARGFAANTGYTDAMSRFGGGGSGGYSAYSESQYSGASGGGASSVRTISTGQMGSLKSRLFVAGAGGGSIKGALASGEGVGGNCGTQGSVLSGSQFAPAQPGTLTVGGAAGILSSSSNSNNSPGSRGLGGDGGDDLTGEFASGGGGGGGLFGGGGGVPSDDSGDGGSGAGGSSSDGKNTLTTKAAGVYLSFAYGGNGVCT